MNLFSELTLLMVCFCYTLTAKGNADLQKVMEKVKAISGEEEPGHLGFLMGSVPMLCHWS